MLINSLLACFILSSAGEIAQCLDSSSNEKIQKQQNQTSQEEYIPAVIYFATDDLAAFVTAPEIETIEEEDITQVFVIRRDK